MSDKTIKNDNSRGGKSTLRSIFADNKDKLSAVRVAFIIWIISVCLVWGSVSLYQGRLEDLPLTIFRLTWVMYVTKVTNTVIDWNWERIIRDTVGAIVHRGKSTKKKPNDKTSNNKTKIKRKK
jgi:hypothetical protein